MNEHDFDPLLNDLLADSEYRQFRAELKQRALGQIRRRRFWRRARALGLFSTVVILAAGFAFWQFNKAGLSTLALNHSDKPQALSSGSPLKVKVDAQIQTISDDELLAMFPPQSVFLAELNGQAVLVFRDEDLRNQLMR